jgi:hypothetical protein
VLRLSRDQAIRIVAPHAERLYQIGAAPFPLFQSTYPNVALHSSRTRANILYDLMVIEARKEFDGVKNTRIIDAPMGVTLIEIDEKVLIRCKKLDDEGLPSNYPTERAKDYDDGDDLPGIPPAPQRLTLGYRLNRLQTAVRDVLISNTTGGRFLYDIILDEPGDDNIVILGKSPKDKPPTSGNAEAPKRRVRIRASEEQTEIEQ